MRWEYLIVKVHKDLENREFGFNSLGEDGYELVTVENDIAYFKQPIKEDSAVKQTFTKEQRRIIDYFGGKSA